MITRCGELEPSGPATTVVGPTAADVTVSDDTRRRTIEAVSAKTRRAYGRQWETFTTWCAEHDRNPLPPDIGGVHCHLADAGRSPATIDLALACALLAADRRVPAERLRPSVDG